jgi:hypothetical protein
MAESKGFEPLRQGYPPTRFPIVLLRPTRTPLRVRGEIIIFTFSPGSDLLSQGLSPRVPSALEGLTVVFGMGTRVSPPLWPPDSIPSKLVGSILSIKPSTDSYPSAQRVTTLTPRTDPPRLLQGVLPKHLSAWWEISS